MPNRKRKRQLLSVIGPVPVSDHSSLDLGRIASVEVTSEQDGYPIESALFEKQEHQGWRAAVSGPQTIRLTFDEPQNLGRVRLVFEEAQNTRTQEFVLRWSTGLGGSSQEIVRQQWNFSPDGSVLEIEDYAVELFGVRVLELVIVPDKSDSEAWASLKSLRLA